MPPEEKPVQLRAGMIRESAMAERRELARLRLFDLRDPESPGGRDPRRIVADLVARGAAQWPERRQPADHDHLVLAEDAANDRPLALLSADTCVVGGITCLILDTAYIAPGGRGRQLFRRLVATALLAAARIGPVPRAIAMRSYHPRAFRALRGLARRLDRRVSGVVLYPALQDGVVPLHAAALARGVARHLSPHARLEPTSGVLAAAALWHGMAGAPRLVANDPAIDAVFARRLGAHDMLMGLIDLRAPAEEAILDAARRLRRQRG